MNHITAMRLALEALQKLWLVGDAAAIIANPAITALTAALAEPTIKEDLMVQRIGKAYNLACDGMLYLKEGDLTNCLLAIQDSVWELEPVIEHFSKPKESQL
jgi:hypothetical protein